MKDSLKAASDALAYHPDSVDLLLRKASWNVRLEEWGYAKDTYDKVLNREPYNVAALYYRAFVNEKLHRFNFARIDYENLLLIVPGNFEAQLGLALLNQKDNHFTEAMDQINGLLAQFPDSAIIYAARGGMEMERGMLEPATYDYTEAIRRDSLNTDYRLSRIDLYIRMRRLDAAKADLDELVKLGVPRANLMVLYRRLK